MTASFYTVRWQTALRLNTKDQFPGLKSSIPLLTRRNGIQETIEAFPTIMPSHGTRDTKFNHSEGSHNLADTRTASTPQNMNHSDPEIGTADKTSYSYVKGAKTKSGVIKTYNSEPNLQKFPMETVEPFHKAAPIEILKKINYPQPKEIDSIKSKLEDFQSAGPIESIKDRLVDIPVIPKIDDIPGIDSVLSKIKWEEGHDKWMGNQVQKRQIFLNKEKSMSFGKEKESHKYTGEELKGNVKTNRFRSRMMDGCGLEDCKITHRENSKHSTSTANVFKPTLVAPLLCKQQNCLCALLRTKKSTLLTKLLQKKGLAHLTLRGNPVELPGTGRVKIDPPEVIKPIDKLMLEFEVAKKIGNIQDHVIKPESVQKIEDISKHLQDIKHQAPVPPILDSAVKVEPIPPVELQPMTKA